MEGEKLMKKINAGKLKYAQIMYFQISLIASSHFPFKVMKAKTENKL